MLSFSCKKILPWVVVTCFTQLNTIRAQTNLLLNGSFEDINVCTEYSAECGVEGWFYLKDVKAQMLSDYDPTLSLGANSFGIFYNWIGYTGFTPVIGTLLPCHLQKGKQYIFKGMISAKLNGRLDFKPGIVLGEKFYVPHRPFSVNMHPDSITQIKKLPGKPFYEFEYRFTASGKERYLTFGSYIHEDSTSGKRAFVGTQSISLVLDNFQLLSAGDHETVCNNFITNREKIYNYNSRHKQMDYSLYGKGELNIPADDPDSNSITIDKQPETITVKADTLKFSDVFFDFNRANLKPAASAMMQAFFIQKDSHADSIYLDGHTDSIGSNARNYELSIQRCESVMTWLLQNGILTKERVQIHPFGKTRPIATNSTAAGRALNRRVEMIIFSKPATGK